MKGELRIEFDSESDLESLSEKLLRNVDSINMSIKNRGSYDWYKGIEIDGTGTRGLQCAHKIFARKL